MIDALHFTDRVGSSINNEHYLKGKMSMTPTLAYSWAVWVVKEEFEYVKGVIRICMYFISLSNTHISIDLSGRSGIFYFSGGEKLIK